MKRNKGNCKPLQKTNELGMHYLGCWDDAEYFRKGKGVELPDWDEHCYLPMAACLSIVGKTHPNWDAYIEDAQCMAACAPWRIYKQIYAIHPELEALLYEQADETMVPDEAILNLPYPCIYIESPKLMHLANGFFVHIESDNGRLEMRFTILFNDERVYCQIIHLVPNGTIEDCIRSKQIEAQRVAKAKFNTFLPIEGESKEEIAITSKMLQLVLYICAQNAEVSEDSEQRRIYRKTSIIRDKYTEVRKWNYGSEIGIAICKYKSKSSHDVQSHPKGNGMGGLKSPHPRRGHWHHYWSGSGDGKKLILKWAAPTFIHLDSVLESHVTITEVEPEKNAHIDTQTSVPEKPTMEE